MTGSPYGVRVDLDPALARELSLVERRAAQVHVLRARADDLRGPDGGERALLLAIRASEIEAELLAHVGLDVGADVLRRMAEHPATLAAVDRWRYAQRLARRLLDEPGDGAGKNPQAGDHPAGDHPAGDRPAGDRPAGDRTVVPLHRPRRPRR